MRIIVHQRIHERHPEINNDDVIAALRALMAEAYRDNNTWIGIGLDLRGRSIELVYKVHPQTGDVLVYHAFTPPTKTLIQELQGRKGA